MSQFLLIVYCVGAGAMFVEMRNYLEQHGRKHWTIHVFAWGAAFIWPLLYLFAWFVILIRRSRWWP